MDVKLSDDNMKDIIAKAVLDTLTPEKRTELIASAVKGMLTKEVGTGYHSKSPLQTAFDSAVREVAGQIAREQIVGNDDVTTAIRGLVSEAWVKLLHDDTRPALVDKLVAALEKGLTGDRY